MTNSNNWVDNYGMSSQTVSKYTKDNPFVSELLKNHTLNKHGSNKDTRHFVISLKDSDIEYKPGDALYVYAENDADLIVKVFSYINLELDQVHELERFSKDINITRLSNKLYKLIETKTNGAFNSQEAANKYEGYNLASFLKEIKELFPNLELSSSEIAENSSKLQARAYSIASSLSAHPHEVHLCIAIVQEEVNNQKIFGVCSNYLAHRVPLHQKELRIYLHNNDKFRLPANSETNIIMVGPGTGIAPFRAFIEERNHLRDQGHKVGKDWLFFGDQKAACDYLYQEELESYVEKYGLKVTTAFSRDQAEKIYVQNRMKEHATEIFHQLENGAYFYVCGDARRMAKDVDLALHEIIKENGKNAEEYIKLLKDTGRYCRDVY